MKYWTMEESLNRLIALKTYDKDAYLHLGTLAMLSGIGLGVDICYIFYLIFLK